LAGWLSAQGRKPAPATGEQVRAVVEKALPAWDESVLKVEERRNWAAGVDAAAVFRAMREEAPLPKDLPAKLERIQSGESVVRINTSLGKVRYVNRARAWNFEKHANTKLSDAETATKVIVTALQQLRLPTDELGKPSVAAETAIGGRVGEAKATDRFELYRVVTIPRMVNKLPVYDSRVHAAVNAEAEIQRLQVSWPAFQLMHGAQLRPRAEVVNEVVAQIMAQGPPRDVKIEARLAYAPRTHDDEEITYVPTLVVSVYAAPTPYQLLVPVAEMSPPVK